MEDLKQSACERERGKDRDSVCPELPILYLTLWPAALGFWDSQRA